MDKKQCSRCRVQGVAILSGLNSRGDKIFRDEKGSRWMNATCPLCWSSYNKVRYYANREIIREKQRVYQLQKRLSKEVKNHEQADHLRHLVNAPPKPLNIGAPC